MPKQALDSLTESMFYVLMALYRGEKCGIDSKMCGDTENVFLFLLPHSGFFNLVLLTKFCVIYEK